MNLATEKQIAKALAYQLGFAYVNLAENPPDPAAVTLIPKEVALKCACLAIRVEKQLLTVAMADPLLFSLVQDLEFQTGRRIKQVVATRAEIIEAIQTSYPDKALARVNPADLALQAKAQPGAAPDADAPEAGAALVRRVEDDVFEPAVALQQRSEAAPII